MTPKTSLSVATVVSAAGVAFSGYLSFIRASSGICAFAEPCPFFLGHPACYTGLALFGTAWTVCVAGWAFARESRWPAIANSVVAAVGILFAGRMTAIELPAHAGYRLWLPTCAYGLVFFVALLVVSTAGLRRRRVDQAKSHTPIVSERLGSTQRQ